MTTRSLRAAAEAAALRQPVRVARPRAARLVTAARPKAARARTKAARARQRVALGRKKAVVDRTVARAPRVARVTAARPARVPVVPRLAAARAAARRVRLDLVAPRLADRALAVLAPVARPRAEAGRRVDPVVRRLELVVHQLVGPAVFPLAEPPEFPP